MKKTLRIFFWSAALLSLSLAIAPLANAQDEGGETKPRRERKNRGGESASEEGGEAKPKRERKEGGGEGGGESGKKTRESFDSGPLTPAATYDPWKGGVNDKGVTINPCIMPQCKEKKIWQPDLSKEGTVAKPCRIVDFGDDMGAYHVGYGNVRLRASDNQITGSGNPFQHATDFDVNGNGKTDDDFVEYMEFSMEKNMSISPWPYSQQLPETNNGVYYGGTATFLGNSKFKGKKESKVGYYEIGLNPNHSGPYESVNSENQPMNTERDSKGAESFHKTYWWYLWKKEDFMNKGDQYTVTFDKNSRILSVIGRGYFWGIDVWHYVVQDGEKFYVSDDSGYDLPTDFALDAGFYSFTPMIKPTEVKWAEVPKPEGYKMAFDKKTAKFEPHEFKDVRAVGWIVGKSNDLKMSAHVKWYSFGCDAVVLQPKVPSVHVATSTVNAGSVPPFHIAKTEVPYSLWKKIYRWANSPVFTFEGRYVFEKSGDMGSMGFGEKPHEQEEPVTNLNYHDALAWCNALSEIEGKEPCYYVDADFKTPFRNFEKATLLKTTRAIQKDKELNHAALKKGANPPMSTMEMKPVYVKWDADGWRLPTATEWSAAYEPATPTSGDSTAPVGKEKNGKDIHDMAGNVRELVWTHGDVLQPNFDNFVALGGDFTGKNGGEITGSAYGDTPFSGNFNIGFRPVCRDKGAQKPAADAAGIKSGVPQWLCKKGERVNAKPAGKTNLGIEMVELPPGSFDRADDKKNSTTIYISPFAIGKTEVTYAQWKKVRDWGEANGYSFGNPGDMGSHWNFFFPHRPDEPVVNITMHDMYVWLNALSEMEGKKPCYYADKERKQVYKKAHVYRPIKFSPMVYSQLREKKWRGATWPFPEAETYKDYMNGTLGRSYIMEPWIWQDWTADGYRMPTFPEYEYAGRGGTHTEFFWGESRSPQENDYAWTVRNAGGRTHPVAQKKPNPFGLYDIVGNVLEAANGLAAGAAKRNLTRPVTEDVIDPKYDRNFDASGAGGDGGTRQYSGELYGCSWYDGQPETAPHGGESVSGPTSTCGFADLGFRVARTLPAPTVEVDGKVYRAVGPKAAELMKADGKKVTVTGEILGDAIIVESVK